MVNRDTSHEPRIMLEFFQNFEQVAARFTPLVLIVPGLTAVIVGLFIWLGGLGFRRLLVALVGAISGSICGFFLISRNITSAVVSAGLVALIAIIFQRVFIAILTAALAAVLGFVVLAGPYIEEASEAAPIDWGKMSHQSLTIGARESIETAKAYAADFGNKIRQACSRMPVYSWAIIAALAVIFIVVGFLLWRSASALCCSALGTTLIFTGMILLLLCKGSAPISKMCSRTSLCATVFISMTAFGTIEQLLLCRRAERKAIREKQTNKDKHEPERTTQSWRNK